MRAIAQDFGKLILPLHDHGVPLAGPMGDGAPIITLDLIAFNGLNSCGHAKNPSVVIPWPTPDAGGLSGDRAAVSGASEASLVTLIDSRTCNGSCRSEPFRFERVAMPTDWEKSMDDLDGRTFGCCKSAFRPYDIAVCSVLLIAKRHLGDRIRVCTDGTDTNWFDSKMLCQTVLGYGLEYALIDGELAIADPGWNR